MLTQFNGVRSQNYTFHDHSYQRFPVILQTDRQTNAQTNATENNISPVIVRYFCKQNGACFNFCYCRAMLCISAAYAVVRRLSVRLSVTFVYPVETNKPIFSIFSPSDSHIIPVFPCQTLWQYSDGDPLTGAKKLRFST